MNEWWLNYYWMMIELLMNDEWMIMNDDWMMNEYGMNDEWICNE